MLRRFSTLPISFYGEFFLTNITPDILMEKLLAAVTARVTPDERKQLSAIAEYRGMDTSSLVRILIRKYLDEKRGELSILLDVFEGIERGNVETVGTCGTQPNDKKNNNMNTSILWGLL